MTDVKLGTPMGGTELILNNLQTALPDLTSQVQIMMSRPQNYTFEDKPRILWLQDLPEDPASAVLRDASYRTQFNRIVFASYWQQQRYNLILGIPFHEGVVIKNGVPFSTNRLPKTKGDGKLKFIYTSTPHRGLAVLASAAQMLADVRQDWELHVYSSLNIYGWHERDKDYQPLYDHLQKNPCVVYHGSQPNPVVREALNDAHVFVYPSIYAETSCMAVQEALMAGNLVITSSYGALPETCADWSWMMPFDERPEMMVEHTAQLMLRALEKYDDESVQNTLRVQSSYYQQFWSFESRVPRWKNLLETVISEGTPQQKLVYNMG
tara:strand:+ start:1061 stop:2029 length:969 start_codon:yes stop_codon:yes gene_type:complete